MFYIDRLNIIGGKRGLFTCLVSFRPTFSKVTLTKTVRLRDLNNLILTQIKFDGLSELFYLTAILFSAVLSVSHEFVVSQVNFLKKG